MRPAFPKKAATALVRAALVEDIGAGDITSSSVIPAGTQARAVLIAKSDGIIAGLPIFTLAFAKLDKRVRTKLLAKDGDRCRRGQLIAELRGPARALLSAERTALNFLQRLSGIATLTSKFVAAVYDRHKSSKTDRRSQTAATIPKILDTRKTTPTLRALEKYAVAVGGGTNHRLGLYDRILIKDNHLKILQRLDQLQKSTRNRKTFVLLPGQSSVISTAVATARAAHPHATVEVEAQSLSEVAEAAESGADIILLDNMSAAELKEAVALVRGVVARVPSRKLRQGTTAATIPKLEVSGGITLANVGEIATSGVDYISIGALTHSAPALDFSLEVEE